MSDIYTVKAIVDGVEVPCTVTQDSHVDSDGDGMSYLEIVFDSFVHEGSELTIIGTQNGAENMQQTITVNHPIKVYKMPIRPIGDGIAKLLRQLSGKRRNGNTDDLIHKPSGTKEIIEGADGSISVETTWFDDERLQTDE